MHLDYSMACVNKGVIYMQYYIIYIYIVHTWLFLIDIAKICTYEFLTIVWWHMVHKTNKKNGFPQVQNLN